MSFRQIALDRNIPGVLGHEGRGQQREIVGVDE
jgi:hypothetical protein